MFKIILGIIVLLIIGGLHCCLRVASIYDKEIEQIEQEKFLEDQK